VITGERRAFLNGVPVNDEPSDQPGLDEYRTQRSWYFGNDICCGGREFDGAIDDFAIFGRAMTPEEIMTLYTNGIGNETESTNAAGVVTPRLSDDPGSSSFMVTSIEPTGDGGYVLTSSEQAAGDTYTVLSSPDLTTPFAPVAGLEGIPRTEGSTEAMIPASVTAGVTRLFFIIQVDTL